MGRGQRPTALADQLLAPRSNVVLPATPSATTTTNFGYQTAEIVSINNVNDGNRYPASPEPITLYMLNETLVVNGRMDGKGDILIPTAMFSSPEALDEINQHISMATPFTLTGSDGYQLMVTPADNYMYETTCTKRLVNGNFLVQWSATISTGTWNSVLRDFKSVHRCQQLFTPPA